MSPAFEIFLKRAATAVFVLCLLVTVWAFAPMLLGKR